MPDCVYCGAYGDVLDHVVPRCRASNVRLRKTRQAPYRGPTVPACRECNSILSGHLMPSMHDRSRYVANELREKHKNLLAIPKWSDEELAELPIETRNYILQSDRKRDEVLARIYHAANLNWETEDFEDQPPPKGRMATWRSLYGR